MIPLRRIGLDADVDGNARIAQPRMTGAGYLGIGVLQRRDDARNAGRNDGVGAWRRLTMVRAGFERHIERGAARHRAGAPQRLDLGMRSASGLGPAAADDFAVLDDHRADRGIRPSPAKPASAQHKRQRHKSAVVGNVGRCNAAGGGHSAASSPDNSASAASKSFASRKFRYTEANRT
jgi:hypothetical protein